MEIGEAFDYIEQKAQELAKYSDKLRTSFKEIDKAFNPLFASAGLMYRQEEPFFSDSNFEYVLAIEKDSSGYWGFYYKFKTEPIENWLGDASRVMLKAAIPRLPGLVSEYVELLDKKTEEYRIVSEMSEAMSEAVKKVAEKEAQKKAEEIDNIFKPEAEEEIDDIFKPKKWQRKQKHV